MTITQFFNIYGGVWLVGLGSIAIITLGASPFSTLLGITFIIMASYTASVIQEGADVKSEDVK